jgi:hypothetical protein
MTTRIFMSKGSKAVRLKDVLIAAPGFAVSPPSDSGS